MDNEKKNENTFTVPSSSSLSEDELKALNIPPRDEASYPTPSQEDILEAGDFIHKLTLMASSLDQNLNAIVWNLFIKMNDYLHKDLEGSSIRLAMSLEELKEYLVTSKNPIFANGKDQEDQNNPQ